MKIDGGFAQPNEKDLAYMADILGMYELFGWCPSGSNYSVGFFMKGGEKDYGSDGAHISMCLPTHSAEMYSGSRIKGKAEVQIVPLDAPKRGVGMQNRMHINCALSGFRSADGRLNKQLLERFADGKITALQAETSTKFGQKPIDWMAMRRKEYAKIEDMTIDFFAAVDKELAKPEPSIKKILSMANDFMPKIEVSKKTKANQISATGFAYEQDGEVTKTLLKSGLVMKKRVSGMDLYSGIAGDNIMQEAKWNELAVKPKTKRRIANAERAQTPKARTMTLS